MGLQKGQVFLIIPAADPLNPEVDLADHGCMAVERKVDAALSMDVLKKLFEVKITSDQVQDLLLSFSIILPFYADATLKGCGMI
jgi:hypothetical protein